ncbi:hypothetical protein CU098_003837 [Rhizopus stolonifer]|uniref:F-box domain-containing protein n=1 Tax=Rhizopus stolonifer TaxID=4846 RepID=A0A367KNA8_RHIST|nr:hypothetical protein CU098_003837 [Rhizopus stolonifer]
MPLWSSLPQELVVIVLSFLNTTDIMQCQLICHNWSRVCQKAAYADISINNATELEQFLQAAKTPLGKLVKKLYVKNAGFFVYKTDGVIQFPFVNFDSMFSPGVSLKSLPDICPNLESLDFKQTDKTFYDWVLIKIKKGYWKHLCTLPFTKEMDQGESYSQAIIAMREKIKNIKLSARGTSFPTCQLLCNTISTFGNLEKLCIQSFKSIPLDLDELIDKVPMLKELSFKGSQSRLDAWFDMYRSLSIKKRIFLKSLSIIGHSPTENSLVYVVNKFPNLRRLNICSERLYMPHPALSTDTMQRFTELVKGLDEVSIDSLQFDNMLELAIMMFDKLANKRIRFNLYLKNCYLNQIRSSELSIKTARLCEGPGQDKDGLFVVISNMGNQISLDSALEQFKGAIKGLKVENTGHHIVNFVSRGDDYKDIVHKHYINDIIATCPNLKKLTFYKVKLIDCSMNQDALIKSLKIQNCSYLPSVLHQFSLQLPCLSHLALESSRVIDPHNLNPLPEDPDHILIDMPYTAFKLLSITELRFSRKRKCIYVRLSTTDLDRYYQVEETTVSSIAAEDYEKTLPKKSLVNLHIRCEKLLFLHLLENTIKIEKNTMT